VGFPGSQVRLGPYQAIAKRSGSAKALYDGVFFLPAFAPPSVELWFLSTAPSLVFK
jgi:hypothetical protein